MNEEQHKIDAEAFAKAEAAAERYKGMSWQDILDELHPLVEHVHGAMPISVSGVIMIWSLSHPATGEPKYAMAGGGMHPAEMAAVLQLYADMRKAQLVAMTQIPKAAPNIIPAAMAAGPVPQRKGGR